MVKNMQSLNVYGYIYGYYKANLFVPTYREIAEEFECSTDTVFRVMCDLRKRGLIIKKEKYYRISKSDMIKAINESSLN